MTLPRTLASALVTASVLAAFAACDDSSSSGGGGTTFDGGTFDGGGVTPPTPPPTPPSGPTDGGTEAGPVSLGPLASCDATQRLDTRGGVVVQSPLTVLQDHDKWVALWPEDGALSSDVYTHLRSRMFDGAAFGAEADLGRVNGPTFASAADQSGHAFMTLQTDTGYARRVFDFAAGTWSASDPVTQSNATNPRPAMVPRPGGGALHFYPRPNNTLAVEAWLPAAPTWTSVTPPPVSLAGGPSTDNRNASFAADTNAAGKVIAVWLAASATDGIDLSVATYDGATWSTPKSRNFPSAGPAPIAVGAKALSNGDAAIVIDVGILNTTTTFIRFDAATGMFGADVPIAASTGQFAPGSDIAVDPADHVTIVWGRSDGSIHARRDVGAGFAADENLGTGKVGQYFRLDTDRATGATTVLYYADPDFRIQRIGGTATTWSAAIPVTGLAVAGGFNPWGNMAVGFDASGQPIVFAYQPAPMGQQGSSLAFTKCH